MPATFQEHLKLLMDLQVIAFQAEITRVSTLMFARELSGADLPGDGHPRSVPQPVAPLERSRQHGSVRAAEHLPHDEVRLFPRALKATPDGDGTLLDHSLVLYGSSLSDGNQHNFSPLPIVLAGGASGQLKGGRHLQFPKDTRMSNLLAAMLNKLGAPIEKFGDGTGVLDDLDLP